MVNSVEMLMMSYRRKQNPFVLTLLPYVAGGPRISLYYKINKNEDMTKPGK